MLKSVSVCLVEPTYALNVGYVARLCANFGVKKLILTSPRFELDEAIRYSTGGHRYIEQASIYNSLELAIKGENPSIVVATTSIVARRPANVLRATTEPRILASQISPTNQRLMLVLGRDTTGLTNEEIQLCDLTVSINTGTLYRTMNISHAASIILYELHIGSKAGKAGREVDRNLVERVVQGVDRLARDVNFKQYRVHLLTRSLRHLLTRAQPERRELTLLLGLVNKIRLRMKAEDTSNP